MNSQKFLQLSHENIPDGKSLADFDSSKPDVSLELEHVHGYSGHSIKQACFFGKTNNEVVYPTAAIGVVTDLKNNKQKFFGGGAIPKNAEKYEGDGSVHQDNISAIDIAGGDLRNIIVTGEVGKNSTVHVWDATTMTSLAKFDLGPSAKGVAAVGISPCQRYVAVSDMTNDHTMYIYNVTRKKMLLDIASGNNMVTAIKWSKKQNDLRFVALNSQNIQFWNPADASKKLFRPGTFGTGNKFKQTPFNCATFDEDGICYSGGKDGGVYIWDQKMELGLMLKAHAADVTGITASHGTMVSTGRDDMLSVFSYDQGEYQFLRQIALEQFSSASSLDILDGRILVGHDNGILQTLNVDGSNKKVIAASHFDGEVWGLDTCSEAGSFMTCGDDNTIYEFSVKDKSLVRKAKIWSFDLNDGQPFATSKMKPTASTLSKHPYYQQGRAIAYSAKNGHVAVSNNYGDVIVLDYATLSKKIATCNKAREWSEVMAYSPDETMLAVGGHDDAVYVYKITGGSYTLVAALDENSSAITALDWSRDGRYIRTVDQAYDKLYYDLTTGKQEPHGSENLLDSTLWESNTCKLGWSTQGVYMAGMDGTDINSVDVNDDQTLVVASDDKGSVCLYRYPVVSNKHNCARLSAHAEHVVRARFARLGKGDEQTHVITVGGQDKSIMQWKIVPAAKEDEK